MEYVLILTEMSIIEEYERNLQFEEQYISSVVEGLNETHIICPVCGVSVCLKPLTFSKRYHTCMIFFKSADWLGFFKMCFSYFSCLAGEIWASAAILSPASADCTWTLRFVSWDQGVIFAALRFHRIIKEKMIVMDQISNLFDRKMNTVFFWNETVDKVSWSLPIRNEI